MASLPPSDEATLTHVQSVLQTRTLSSPIYAFILTPLRITHASRGLIIARLVLAAPHLNASGSLHGGVSATLVDWAGGCAISTWDLRTGTGVSVDINISYLGGAKLGEEIEIEGRADKVGGSLAFTSVGIWKVEDGGRGSAVAVGRHTKFVRGSASKKVEDAVKTAE
ncbi:thioesterase family protein [Microthyrium microscopicum]|uniref:Thioesterase family protein n=1 Tax=Microthyrium microscopicum TaxID=703497 RepID=A0A6A6UJ91_9PEZI|nr:thioesterase family protein [Microthyrium microscopicum]